MITLRTLTISKAFGAMGLTLMTCSPSLAQELLWVWDGETAGDFLGEQVAGAGDVNGDGVPDVLAAAPMNDTIARDAGMIQVLSGKDGSILHSIYGAWEDAFLGYAVSGFGDLDRDGKDDFLVSAMNASATDFFSGVVWLYSGFDGSVLKTWSPQQNLWVDSGSGRLPNA